MTQAMRIIGFPGRYVQGPGALKSLPDMLTELGAQRPVLVSDDIVQAAVGQQLPPSLPRLRFGGECTREVVADLARQAAALEADTLIALGGGKTIDTAKGVARALGTRLVIVPSVASNDSPTSRLIVLYDDAHRLVAVDYLARNPDLVLVDTEVIVQAPLRFFRAGIGDAVSKRYEARQCALSGGKNFFGGRPPDVALVMAERCHAALAQYAPAALAAVSRKEVTPEVEAVVEATVLLSGLAFESGGLSLSHALLRGLTAIPALAEALHGEMVAYGSLVQLCLEARSDEERRAHASWLVSLGLPVTAAQLGARLSATEQQQVAELTMNAPYIGHFERPLTAADIAQAINTAEQIGQTALAG